MYQESREEELKTTGILLVEVSPKLDIQLLMDTFLKEDPTGELLAVFMDGGDFRGFSATQMKQEKIQEILTKARKRA